MRDFWRASFPAGRDRRWWLPVGLVTLIGFLYRLAYLSQPAGFDEAYTYLAFARQPIVHIFTDYSYPNNHIFHSLMVALTTRLIPISAIWVMRLPAFIAGVVIIPVTFLAGWKLYRAEAGLLAAALVAANLSQINFSAEARGYTLVCLFSAALLWLAACLLERSHWTGWLTLSLYGILGAWTIPIMLYPLAGVYTWLFVEKILRSRKMKEFAGLFVSAGLTFIGALVGYLPVILLGTGWKSLVANSYVAPLGSEEYFSTLFNKFTATWQDWFSGQTVVLAWLLGISFLISLVLHRRQSRTKIHPALPSIVVILLLVIIQRVAPLPRIWQFAQSWFLVWAAGGLSSVLAWICSRKTTWLNPITVVLAGLLLIQTGLRAVIDYPILNQPGVEESVAAILIDQAEPDELIAVVAPSGTQVKYYFSLKDDYRNRFYYNEQPQQFSAIIAVVNDKYEETLPLVLQKNRLTDLVDMNAATELDVYKQVTIYRVPLMQTP